MSHLYLSLHLLDFFGVEVFLSADFLVGAFLDFSAFLAGASFAGLRALSTLTFGPASAFSTFGATFFSTTGFGSVFSILRVSPGLPMKITINRVYCWR